MSPLHFCSRTPTIAAPRETLAPTPTPTLQPTQMPSPIQTEVPTPAPTRGEHETVSASLCCVFCFESGAQEMSVYFYSDVTRTAGSQNNDLTYLHAIPVHNRMSTQGRTVPFPTLMVTPDSGVRVALFRKLCSGDVSSFHSDGTCSTRIYIYRLRI